MRRAGLVARLDFFVRVAQPRRMDAEAREFLFELLNTPSPSGFESGGQRCWAQYVGRFADRMESDSYGTAWATLEGSGGDGAPTVMLEAHCDEIGFMVRYVSKEGFLHINQIGGSDRAIVRGKRVILLGRNGPVPGVIGVTAIHLRDAREDKLPEWHQLFIDTGASSRREVEKQGIRVGCPAVLADRAEELAPGRIVGRALDNRLGGFIVAQTLRRLARGKRPVATIFGVNAVQEEIGLKGAQMIAFRLRPSVAVILDVTHATDTPGIEKEKHGEVKLGGGPSVTHGSSNHPKVIERLVAVAARKKIPLQHESSSRFTGTDTDSIYVSAGGIPSGLVSLPMRYMHSTIESVDLRDVERCVGLLEGFARSVRRAGEFHADPFGC